METNLKGIVGVTILVGLVFLSLATLAFINYNFKEAIPITTNTTTLNYIIDVNTPQTLTYEPTATATLTTPNQTWLNVANTSNSLVNISSINLIPSVSSNNSNFSILVLVKPLNYSFNTSNWIIAKGHTNNFAWGIELNGTGYVVGSFWRSSGVVHCQVKSLNNNTLNQWTHIALTLNETNCMLYINSKIVGQSARSFTNNMSSTSSEVLFGRRGDATTNKINMSLAKFEVYNTTLTNAQIVNSYKSEKDGLNKTFVTAFMQHGINESGQVSYVGAVSYLDFYSSQGFQSITDVEYYNWTQGRITIPEKSIMFIFDDGRLKAYNEFAPLLASYGYKGVLAVTTELISETTNETYMNWTNVNTLINVYNWSIASHSSAHCSLGGIYAGTGGIFCNTSSSILGNLTKSMHDIINKTGIKPISFIHPYNDWNTQTMANCSINYTLCWGGDTYGKNAKYLTLDTNFTNGNLTRVDGNFYYPIEAVNFTIPRKNLLAYIDFNENNGTIAYDSSGNGNNGIISGASWQTDGQTRTVTNGYSIAGTTFTLTDSELAYSNLNLSYLYESEDVVARDVLDAANLELVNSTPIAGLILTISLIAVVISIILGTFLIRMRGL